MAAGDEPGVFDAWCSVYLVAGYVRARAVAHYKLVLVRILLNGLFFGG